MAKSRRQFLKHPWLAWVGAAAGCGNKHPKPGELPPGAPPAFGTSPLVGPEISPSAVAEAEKLVQIELTKPEREMAAASWRANMAALYERRTGPRKVPLEPSVAPFSRWNSVLPGEPAGPGPARLIPTEPHPRPFPEKHQHLA